MKELKTTHSCVQREPKIDASILQQLTKESYVQS